MDLGWRSLSLTTTYYLSGNNWQVLMSSKPSQGSSGFSTPISPRHILGALNKHRQWDFVRGGQKQRKEIPRRDKQGGIKMFGTLKKDKESSAGEPLDLCQGVVTKQRREVAGWPVLNALDCWTS